MYSMKKFRLLDTGVLTAGENIAWDHALLLAKSRYNILPTLRFLQFAPDAVLIGRYQTVEQEVRTEFCRVNEIDINRRITGGGAILFNTAQLGWELIASYDDISLPNNMEARFKAICEGCIKGLEYMGLNARFRPVNDIEINHRKISGTGGIDEENAFLFQGTLLIDFDAQKMIKSLRIPIEKLQDKEIESVKDRVTWIKKELQHAPPLEEIKNAICKGFEEVFNISLQPGHVTPEEQELFNKHQEYFNSPQWIHKIKKNPSQKGTLSSTYKSKGGLIRTNLSIDARNKIIQQALITGDFFVHPREAVYDLETIFKNIRANQDTVFNKIDYYFNQDSRRFLGISPTDIKTAVGEALKKVELLDYGCNLHEADNIATVAGHFKDIIHKKKIKLLLPYCSKKTGCAYRYRKDCGDHCSACSVGDAAGLGREFHCESESVTSFEDLVQTLERLRGEGYDAFIGCCCRAFLTKHRDDFERCGLPGILVDIDSETCYDLGLQQDAYLGKFESQTHLRLDLLHKTLSLFKQNNVA